MECTHSQACLGGGRNFLEIEIQALKTAILSTIRPVEQVVLFLSASSWVRVEGLYQTLPSEVKLGFPKFGLGLNHGSHDIQTLHPHRVVPKPRVFWVSKQALNFLTPKPPPLSRISRYPGQILWIWTCGVRLYLAGPGPPTECVVYRIVVVGKSEGMSCHI